MGTSADIRTEIVTRWLEGRGRVSSDVTWRLAGFLVVPIADLLDEFDVVPPVKRHGSIDQCVEEHSQGPAVHLETMGTQHIQYETLQVKAAFFYLSTTRGSKVPSKWILQTVEENVITLLSLRIIWNIYVFY